MLRSQPVEVAEERPGTRGERHLQALLRHAAVPGRVAEEGAAAQEAARLGMAVAVQVAEGGQVGRSTEGQADHGSLPRLAQPLALVEEA